MCVGGVSLDGEEGARVMQQELGVGKDMKMSSIFVLKVLFDV